jgi:hypothetical protein
LPAFLAFDNPMAMACLGFVTFFPLRPLLSLPFFIAFISVSTLLPAAGEYFRLDFLVADFFVFGVDVGMLILHNRQMTQSSRPLHGANDKRASSRVQVRYVVSVKASVRLLILAVR